MGACAKALQIAVRWQAVLRYTRAAAAWVPELDWFNWIFKNFVQETVMQEVTFGSICFFLVELGPKKNVQKLRKAPLAGEVTTDDVDRFSESVALWLQCTKNLSIQ